MFNEYDDILSIEDLADILHIGTTHAYKLLKSKKIHAYTEGKAWKIPKSSVIKYVLQQSGTDCQKSS